MAGYSSTPLSGKLGIAESCRLVLVNAPDGFAALLEPLPDGVVFITIRSAGVDVIVFFVTRARELDRRFDAIARRLQPAGGLWVAWPKKASGLPTDVDFTVAQETGLASGALVDNKVAALDDTWSGLRFVVRKTHRERWPG